MNKAILIILDGYGEGKDGAYNAVKNAHTPFLHSLKNSSYSLLKTNGDAVGIFENELGGSEVGHTTIGAGRVKNSVSKQIHEDILTGEFEKNANLVKVLNKLKTNKGNLHIVGMMSDKNVHCDINHVYHIVEMAKTKAKNIYLHLFTDGRDTKPFESLTYIKQVKSKIKGVKNCEIASIGGRGYGMDRENNLDRTLLAFNAMFKPATTISADEIEGYLQAQHKAGVNDQFVKPVHVKTKQDITLTDKDVVLMFNFREDRVRQMAKVCKGLPSTLVTMSSVGGVDSIVLYPETKLNNTLCEYLSSKGLKQIKISESTKYAHVTYFFNGGVEEPFPNEDRVHIISHKVENFADTPKMRAGEICKATCKAIKKSYDAIIVNFSNPDMLGHTGQYKETVQGLEFLDKCVQKVVKLARKKGYSLIITADHGNAETMLTEDGLPHMAHTTNRAACYVLTDKPVSMKKYGGLQDVAPTLLALMQIEPSKHFTGKSLIN